MAIIIPRRRRGTWEGVPMATWCNEWICRTWGGLGRHILTFPASLSESLPPMRGAAISRAPTILHDDSFYTRISNFVKSPILSTTASSCGSNAYIANGTFCTSHVHSRPGCWDVGGHHLKECVYLIILRNACIYMRPDLKSRSGPLTRRSVTWMILTSLYFFLDL